MKFSLIFLIICFAVSVSAEMSAQQKKRCEQFISVFENDTIDIEYDYVENIGDGRGYTAGKFGFTTGTGDAYELIKRYTAKKKDNLLAKYLPELQRLAKLSSPSGDVSKLVGYPDAWHQACKDKMFLDTQDEVMNAFTYKYALY